MSSKSPFELMMEQAQAMAKSFPAMEAFSPKGFDKLWPTMPKELMEAWFGNAVNENGLDAKTRLMLTLAGMTMQGAQNEIGLRQTVRHLVELEATDQQVYEAIGMMSMFAGLPASTRAMEIARDVLEDGKDTEE
ncbi:carboxymuconolactone decarboxylase family protein [Aliishimia ponticola]|uniref:Carboxymuconolactone decarboxylase family protein n=1 Tax=Aliishimia ponticola TaxID=2499833 RepID=A0A4S4NH40_9RHOB|nr:carboxymuconolactone decarboxylase family protein [Aliishimia ponticola]THH38982.1 carboxymuconolactone decarboxylase family protein [Aliishimia ponticola]